MAKLDANAKGVYVIAVTPFRDDGALDLASTDRMVDFYLERGADGLTILGIMGEAPKLTAAESREFVKRVLARVAGKVPVIVGVSSPGLAPMQELALAVLDDGAAGVMVTTPSTLKTDDQIYAYFESVVETLGAQTPTVLQDYPLASGVVMSSAILIRILQAMPSYVMLKHEDWPGLAKISAVRAATKRGELRRIPILVGNGGLFLPEEMERGADGAMTGFAFPEMMVDVCKAHVAGSSERAHDLFDAYLPYARYEQQQGIGLTARKYVLAKRGAIASGALRKPAPKLSPADIAEIERLIARQEIRLKELG